jgi:hypothetical protein
MYDDVTRGTVSVQCRGVRPVQKRRDVEHAVEGLTYVHHSTVYKLRTPSLTVRSAARGTFGKPGQTHWGANNIV